MVISLNLLLGLAGQASFAQTTFMAIGGYGSALLTTRLGFDPWVALLFAAIGAFLFAYALGRALWRLRDIICRWQPLRSLWALIPSPMPLHG